MTVVNKNSRKDLEIESYADNINGKTCRRTLPKITFSATTITSITIGSTAVTLVSSNADRTSLWVSNFSNKAIAVRFLEAATDSSVFKGISIPGDASIKVIGDGEVYTGEVSVIGAGLNQEVSATEF